jgi:hypothetical protein
VIEEWRPVPGFEAVAEVSDQGRIRSLPRKHTRGRILQPYQTPKGYLSLGLRDQGGVVRQVKVHRVVAAAFIGPCPEGQVVRHGLGGPSNNRVANLCYGTPAENQADMVRHRQALRAANLELTGDDALEIYRRYINGELPQRLANEYAAIMRHIGNLIKNREQRTVAA